MRFEYVRAMAFGPLLDQELTFVPSLNVIYGPNETGKSSWHAALYAGLCGMRRARGRGTREDVAFADQHRPWDGGGWRVGATVSLEDGRRIELRNDLEGHVDCYATDIALSRDCSNEIMREGAPDGAVWLGLERRSFRAVACVPQGEMLQVLANPALLQEHLQRAAATAGTDATAARALEMIDGFFREHVGLDRANSTRPLRRARRKLEESDRELRAARELHEAFRKLVSDLDEAEQAAARRSDKLRALEALVAFRRAQDLRARLDEATELSERHPVRPPDPVDDEEFANTVASALDLWERRPQAVELSGPSVEELVQKLERLPMMPDGDLEPAEDVTRAHSEVLRARDRLADHQKSEPVQSAMAEQALLDPQELFRLADDLSVEVSEEAIVAEPVLPPPQRGVSPLVIIGGMIFLGGAASLAVGPPALGALMIAVGLGLAGWRVLVARVKRDSASGEDIRDAVAQELRKQRSEEDLGRREAGMQRLRDLGLPEGADQLRDLAREMLTGQEQRRRHGEWALRTDQLRADVVKAEAALRNALTERGHSSEEDFSAISEYEESCRRRARQAAESSRRGDLEGELQARSKTEKAAKEAEALRQDALARLKEMATKARVDGETPEQMTANLRLWQQRRSDEREAVQAARDEWVKLQTILDGSSLEEIRSDYEQHVARADERRTGVEETDAQKVISEEDVETQLTRARGEAEQARKEADRLRGQVEERAAALPPLAEAEEARAAAKVELERVERLGQTLRLTEQFLQKAQERVHRTIAPLLNASVERWLPNVTEGRYRNVRVDPVSLQVTVEDPTGARREASLLSHGTAEQIYLLLRVGLAEHLTVADETCPLLLDDVTVQSDSRRKISILETLKALSEERQVILFSQEEEVLSWARAELQEPQHSVMELFEPPQVSQRPG